MPGPDLHQTPGTANVPARDEAALARRRAPVRVHVPPGNGTDRRVPLAESGTKAALERP